LNLLRKYNKIIDLRSTAESKSSVLKDLKESLVIEICPIVNLELLVEGLYLLSDLILSGGIYELFSCITDVRSVQDE
jgi:hypothetical protein